MLIKNKLTGFLYEFGYTGVDNIYDYWISHKNDIIEAFSKKHTNNQLGDIIKEFQYKVRWSSFMGLYLRIEIEKEISRLEGNSVEFNSIFINYGKQKINLQEFSHMTLPHEQVDLCDLRGISIMSKVFKNTEIHNVDFSYSALDACEFQSITFKNCRFYKTSFNRCRLDQCSFDSDCRFESNDFRNAYIDSYFRSLIVSPQITPITKWGLIHINKAMKAKYLKFTLVIAKSFINQVKDEKAEIALMKVYNKLD